MSVLRSRQTPWLLCGLFLTAILAACASAPESVVQPVQSPNDDKAYRLLTLDNEMQVLLVSDPETPKAAASLDVHVGSGDNPEGRGGLAHFLEHMLFLGTDKYPDAAEYEEFITEHGGNRNAYTSFEHTNYFFDINAPYLPEALDRFAQFFIAPRFDAEYVDREKNAVEAEYQMGLKSDGRRGLDVLQEIMNPGHPFSQFSVGSLESLADRPGSSIRDELLSFYDKYYSANQMRLVVLGAESLDELQSLVAPMFSQVPNKSYELSGIDEPLFNPEQLPMMVQIQPQATQRQLQLLFPIADYRADYHAKPLSYLGNLVGHEGEGSLLSRLKDEGLVESLAAGSGLGWRGGALFSVTVTLTEKGVAEHDRIAQMLFAYMEMLRAEGPKEWLYDEQSRLAELSFRFQEDSSPMGYVSRLATGMHDYRPGDVLQGPYIMDDYQAEMLAGLMESIVPGNAVVILEDADVSTDRRSRHYDTPYSVQSPTAEQLAIWQNPVAEDAFSLPAPNQFIAEDVSLVKLEKDYVAAPVRVLEEGRKTIWFAQDDEFRLPRGVTYINFRSPLVGENARQSASAVLYTAMLKDRVNEFTYPALLAGLNFSVYKHAQGISLRIGGYDDKQSELLDAMLKVMANPDFDGQRYDNIRKDMIRSLENSVAKRPSSQALDDLREALLYGEWGEQPVIHALRDMQLEDVVAYARAFWQSASAEALIYGNYSRDEVAGLSQRLDMLLAQSSVDTVPQLRVLKMDAGESVLYPVDIKHDDAVLAWYLQGGGNSWEDRAATALTAQIMKSGFFQQLRTEQQLGYIASAFAWPQLDVPGLVMLVQSPVADSAALADAMDTFMRGVEASLDEAQFQRHKKALINEVTRPHKNIWERAEFYWQSIAKKQYAFDGRETLAEAIEGLSLEQWQAYYNTVFIEQRRSLQVAAPGKNGLLPAGSQRRVESAQTLKAGHASYLIE
ncbi:insulinase family protein [Pseudohalioglobus lutimaris]|uniref:Protease 3 n=1 Tax=Pseudohalioglobus lutimaris TaxID=1737061 RepID=A0A2N5X7I0_9GAMM|nr:insulinase family protein [Pseudohalioglobus lutimaris]PLW70444.1 peptidase M16 [Pseudohalioglobus lutimaris]